MRTKASFFIWNGILLSMVTICNYFFVTALFTIGIMKYYDYDIFISERYGLILFLSFLFYYLVVGLSVKIIQHLTKSSFKQNTVLLSLSVILAIGFVSFKYSNDSLEAVAFNEGLQQFEDEYMNDRNLFQDEIDRVRQHPDYIELVAYKNNPLLTSSVRKEYYQKLKETSNQLDLLKSNKKTYDISYYPTYFVRAMAADNFLINYANVKDPELQKMMLEMFKYSTIRTSDYIKFHELYKNKFISSNSTLTESFKTEGGSNE